MECGLQQQQQLGSYIAEDEEKVPSYTLSSIFSTQQAQLEVYFEKILLFNYTMKCESNTYTGISDSV